MATTTLNVTTQSFKHQRATSKERRAWYLYDFGNSAYAAVVLLAVYSAYFQGQVVGGAEGSRLWGWAVGIAMFIVALISPILGAIADFSASKKRFLLVFSVLTIIFTALLFFVGPGDVFLGMLFFILAEVGYRASQVFYDALLPEIADSAEMARVSGVGWAIGSMGGIVCLLLVLPLIMFLPGLIGVEPAWAVRFSLALTAVFFALFAAPIFRDVRERAEPQHLPVGENYFTYGFKQISSTIAKARHYREFLKFMLAFLVYNDGVMMTMNFAAIIGAVLFGLTQQGLIVFMIIVQATNVLGAYIFGLWAQRWSAKHALSLSILMMLGAIGWLYVAQAAAWFYVIGALAGVAMAGMQSVSRTLVGLLSPEGQSAEFYGFFNVAGRTSSFIGPTIYGVVAYRTAAWFEQQGLGSLAAQQQGQRMAVLAIGAFLLVGLGLLFLVNERKGRAARELA